MTAQTDPPTNVGSNEGLGAGLRTHQPKGGMCCTCVWWPQNCGALPFESMPVIGVDAVTRTKIVRCTEHSRIEAPN